MAKINQDLLEAIMNKTGLSKAQAYVRIQSASTAEFLPRHLAAIKVAADVGVPISKYATADELSQLRRAGSPVAPPTAPTIPTNPSPKLAANGKGRGSKIKGKAVKNQVFVVHGRDLQAKSAVFLFLRTLGITPIEWTMAIKMSGKPSPYVGQILDSAFAKARAVLVLLTPDDLACLRPDLLSAADPAYERRPMGQARANVLFEAGMAFSSHPDRTVIVQVGTVRPFSDTAGRHIVHMNNSPEKRQELATKLENAGCEIDQSGTDWLSAGDFTDPEIRTPPKTRKR